MPPSPLRIRLFAALIAAACHAGASTGRDASLPPAADVVYRNGYVYTVDPHDSVQQALAIRGGRIAYVGTDAGLDPFIGAGTRIIDLHGRMVMPGLVDGHQHPLQGGASLLKCNLNYVQLNVAQMQARIQSCLDATRAREPDQWLEVVNWFQEGMVPAGTATNSATLDALKTARPIFVMSSFGHTVLANSRAMKLAGITARSPDPLGGRVARDASGNPTGLLEGRRPRGGDQAHSGAYARRRREIGEGGSGRAACPGGDDVLGCRRGGRGHRSIRQRVQEGALTARAHFAVVITPPQGRDPKTAVAAVRSLALRLRPRTTRPRTQSDGSER